MRPLAALALAVGFTLVVTTGLAHAQDASAPRPGTTAMILVPAGEFTMGAAGSADMPPHRVRLSAFLLDEHEVTNAQYLAYCRDTGAEPPVFWGVDRFRCGEAWPDHPLVGVSQAEARKYAEWAGKRLPTEAEWEYAAGGVAQLTFGEVDGLEPGVANYKTGQADGTMPVKSYPPNGFGLYDLIGNVREWTADYYGAEIPAASLVPADGEGSLAGVVAEVDPRGPATGRWRVLKGGGWYAGASCNAVHVRNVLPASWGDFNLGFRCARDAGPGR